VDNSIKFPAEPGLRVIAHRHPHAHSAELTSVEHICNPTSRMVDSNIQQIGCQIESFSENINVEQNTACQDRSADFQIPPANGNIRSKVAALNMSKIVCELPKRRAINEEDPGNGDIHMFDRTDIPSPSPKSVFSEQQRSVKEQHCSIIHNDSDLDKFRLEEEDEEESSPGRSPRNLQLSSEDKPHRKQDQGQETKDEPKSGSNSSPLKLLPVPKANSDIIIRIGNHSISQAERSTGFDRTLFKWGTKSFSWEYPTSCWKSTILRQKALANSEVCESNAFALETLSGVVEFQHNPSGLSAIELCDLNSSGLHSRSRSVPSTQIGAQLASLLRISSIADARSILENRSSLS